jgi:hypothetical protein
MAAPEVVGESCRAPWPSAITALPGDGNISSLSILFFFLALLSQVGASVCGVIYWSAWG